MSMEREKILNAVEKALEDQNGKEFLELLQKNMQSKNEKTRERACRAFQRLMELRDALKNFELYEQEEKTSATFRTIKQMLEHFSNKRKRAFRIMFGVKKWVKNVSIPICYHVHIWRVKGEYSVTFDIGYFLGDTLD